MKKIFLFSLILLIFSCTKKKEHTIDMMPAAASDSISISLSSAELERSNSVEFDPAKEWLMEIFKCKNGNQFCFYMDKEEEVTTPRFYQFMIDSEQIFGATNLSEEEIPAAEKKYRQKYGEIYKVRTDMEPWLFGRAQDDMEDIKGLKIEKIADLMYRVFVDYGEYKTLNEVTLVANNNSYLIDYCDTEYLD